MAALNFTNIFRCLPAKHCPGRSGTLISKLISQRHPSTTHTRVLHHLHPRSKYGRMEIKLAGIVSAEKRQASSCAAAKVAGNDHDGSGSSGRKHREVRRIDLRYLQSIFFM